MLAIIRRQGDRRSLWPGWFETGFPFRLFFMRLVSTTPSRPTPPAAPPAPHGPFLIMSCSFPSACTTSRFPNCFRLDHWPASQNKISLAILSAHRGIGGISFLSPVII